MKAHNEQLKEYAMPDIVVALNDIARLSQEAGRVVPGVHNPVPAALLKRLLRLFKGQWGALLLTLQVPTGSDAMLAQKETLRPFAFHNLSEEDALALLGSTAFDAIDAHEQCRVVAPGWIIGRLALDESAVSAADSSSAASTGKAIGVGRGRKGRVGTETPVVATGETLLPASAMVVIGWTGNDKVEAAEHGQALFPLVADVVGMVIANILFAERVQVLERSSNRKAIAEMELLKAELLATMSHELRSPLASIKGYAATLLRHEQRISFEERHEFLLAINESSDRLAVLIDRLLEMSQLETGTITLEYSTVNLPHLIREAIIALGHLLDGQRVIHFGGQLVERESMHAHSTSDPVTFTLRVEDDKGQLSSEEPVISADRQRLREVLDNLLENAILYSPDGGAVEVVVRPVTLGSNISKGKYEESSSPSPRGATEEFIQRMVEVRIADHGIGIPVEQLERVFHHFHRVDTRLTREVNGLGLGLSICKRIVELHNGAIWAESEPGQGSTFHVLLPLDEW